jgi:hypothetical protein
MWPTMFVSFVVHEKSAKIIRRRRREKIEQEKKLEKLSMLSRLGNENVLGVSERDRRALKQLVVLSFD